MFLWILSLLALVFIFIASISSVLFFTTVSGVSMQPNIKHKDFLIGCRDAKYRRGDVVALFSGAEKVYKRKKVFVRKNGRKIFVKRIVGLPGEEIEIKNGKVYIDGVELKEEYLPKHTKTIGEWNKTYIPKGFVFVMGDNRTVSNDSRWKDFGLVNKENIIATFFMRMFPYNRYGAIK